MHLNIATTASPSSRLPVDIRRFPWFRRLAVDYAYNFDNLAPFFAGNPADPTAWSSAISRAQAHPRDRRAVAEILLKQQERRDAPEAAREAARRLADQRTVAVVTGQQAGLFGGPLFTLLKALTAIKLADRVSRDHGVPVVPIFWVESEDHDWAEVASCSVLDGDMEPRRITLGTPPGAGEGPVASVALDPSIYAAIDQLMATLPKTDFSDELSAKLLDAYRSGLGMSEAFGRWLGSVLGHLGLVVYDSSEAATKPLVGHLFAAELETPFATTMAATESGRALVERGYHSQVVPHPDNVALFRLEGLRQTIHLRDGRFVIGDQRQVDQDELRDEARHHPERFSPNVLLRPIVQDSLFPTVCYVAGPNELAYLAQLKPIYARFGVPTPLMYPRATLTLLDSAGARFLNKYQVSLEALQPDNEGALNQLLEAQLPASVEQALEEARSAVERSMTRLVEAVPAIDPTLEGAAKSSLGRMQHDLRTLHDKIIHAAKKRDETLRRQFTRARAQAFPGGHAQERSVGFVYFLNRYGPALVDRLLAEVPLDMGTHWVVTV